MYVFQYEKSNRKENEFPFGMIAILLNGTVIEPTFEEY